MSMLDVTSDTIRGESTSERTRGKTPGQDGSGTRPTTEMR